MPRSNRSDSSSSTLSSLPTTPAPRLIPEVVTPSGSGPRSRGYPEGMFSTPSGRLVPVIVIPTSEPRTDEVSGISDGGSSLSSLTPYASSLSAMSGRAGTAAAAAAGRKRRRIDDSVSPLSRMSKPPKRNDSEDLDTTRAGSGASNADETIRDSAPASGSKHPRKDAPPPALGDVDMADSDESDDDLPDLIGQARAASASRAQPKRAASKDIAYNFNEHGKETELKRAPPSNPLPSTTSKLKKKAAPKPVFKTEMGTVLSISAMLKRKKEAANKGTDLDGMKEADTLLRETEQREEKEAAEKKRRDKIEQERKDVEAMQRELDLSFLSPPSKGGAASFSMNGALAEGSAAAATKAKPSRDPTRKRLADKPEGGCTSDGLDDDPSDSEVDEDDTLDQDTSRSKARSAEQEKLLSDMSKALNSADVGGRQTLVDIIALEHGLKKESNADRKLASGDSKAPAAGTIWAPGRVEVPKFVIPDRLALSRLGQLMNTAISEGPWTLVSVLQHMTVMSSTHQLNVDEISTLMKLAVLGTDSRIQQQQSKTAASSSSSSSIVTNFNSILGTSTAHPWKIARKERQAVANAACTALEALARSNRRSSAQLEAGSFQQIDVLVCAWLNQTLVDLGAGPSSLRDLGLLTETDVGGIEPARRIRRAERAELKQALGLSSAVDLDEGSKAQAVKKETGTGDAVPDDARLVGWLSLDERLEALTRIGAVIRILCSHNMLAWPTRVQVFVTLAALSAAHVDDGLAEALGDTLASLVQDLENVLSNETEIQQDELAERLFTALTPWPVASYASVLRVLPKRTLRTRAICRAIAWKLLTQRHALLRKQTDVKRPRRTVTASTPSADAVSIPGIAVPDLQVVEDLILTSNDTSPFWISTAADEARQKASLQAAAKAEPGASETLADGKGRRITDYQELRAWTEIVSAALSDVAVQATMYKPVADIKAKGQPGGTKDVAKLAPIFKSQREVKGTLILATRPFVDAFLSGNAAPATQMVPEPDTARFQSLMQIAEGLKSTFNKIHDTRGAIVERSRAKDAIQRAELRLHYLLPFYFAFGSLSDQYNLPEIYGKEDRADDGLVTDLGRGGGFGLEI
ncbi:hypothetical protein V8E36_002380 [Tilletia maclaganii]